MLHFFKISLTSKSNSQIEVKMQYLLKIPYIHFFKRQLQNSIVHKLKLSLQKNNFLFDSSQITINLEMILHTWYIYPQVTAQASNSIARKFPATMDVQLSPTNPRASNAYAAAWVPVRLSKVIAEQNWPIVILECRTKKNGKNKPKTLRQRE